MGLGLIILYILLLWRAYHISSHANDLYGSLIGTAVTTMLGVQIVINLGVVVGWMPSKGLVLPFMSYGASAVVAYLICVGLLLRISSETRVLLDAQGAGGGGLNHDVSGLSAESILLGSVVLE